jgi:hypothetical protein
MHRRPPISDFTESNVASPAPSQNFVVPFCYLFALGGAGSAWIGFNPLLLAWSQPCSDAIAHKPLALLVLAFAVAVAAPVLAFRTLQRSAARRPALWPSALTAGLGTVVLLLACLRWSVGGLSYGNMADFRLGQLTVRGAPEWRQRLVMRRLLVDGARSLPVVRDPHDERTLDTQSFLIDEREVALRFIDDRLVARSFRPDSCVGCRFGVTEEERKRNLPRFTAWPSYAPGREGSVLVYEGPALAPRLAFRLCIAGPDGSVWLAGKLQELGPVLALPVPGTGAALRVALSVLILGLGLRLVLRWKGKENPFCVLTNDFLLLHTATFVIGLLLPVL